MEGGGGGGEGVDTDGEEVRSARGIMGESEGEAEKEKRKRKKIRNNKSFCRRCASHPFAGLFELFAFWDALLSLPHIIQRLQHHPLNIVHQATLHKNKDGVREQKSD